MIYPKIQGGVRFCTAFNNGHMLHWTHHTGELKFLQGITLRKSVSLFLPYYLAQLCGEANGQKAIVVFGHVFRRPHASDAIYKVIQCFQRKSAV